MGTFFNNDYNFSSNLSSFDMGGITFANNSAYNMFSGCSNFNQPMVIPNYLTNVSNMFYQCSSFNSKIDIHPNANITDMDYFISSIRFDKNINIPYNAVNWRQAIACPNFNAYVDLYANSAGWTSGNVGDYINGFAGCNFNGNVRFQHTPVNMSNMFRECSNFNQNIQIPVGPNQNCFAMFENCYNLDRTIKLPDNVDAAYSFYGCSNLSRSITIPTNSNLYMMFGACTNFNAPMYVPAFPQGSDSDSSNGYGIFYDCRKLNSSVTFNDSITVLSNTFYNCHSLDLPITLPSNLKYGYGTFSGCSNFNMPITLPSGLVSMQRMFASSAMNINITIPDSVTDMSSAFSYTPMNQELTLPANVISLDSTFKGCSNLNQNITLPLSTQSCHDMFRDCRNLNTNIHITPSVTDVSGMFWNCYNLYLDSFNIPTNVTHIQNFAYRSRIKNITIDSSFLQWPINNFVSLAYNRIDVTGMTPATTCHAVTGLVSHPVSMGDDIAHISINDNCIINKSGTTTSFNSLWNNVSGTGIVWENIFGGIGVGITQYFQNPLAYNNHAHLQVLYSDGRREIYYHDLMNYYPTSSGNEWNVYHINLSFF